MISFQNHAILTAQTMLFFSESEFAGETSTDRIERLYNKASDLQHCMFYWARRRRKLEIRPQDDIPYNSGTCPR